jgi:hypothetical protein
MGTHRKKLFSGPLFDGYSQPSKKRQKQLVEGSQCRGCGSPLGRAKTICDTCADKDAARLAAAAVADKAAERQEAEKNSPLLAPSELQALPQFATGKQKIKGVKERRQLSSYCKLRSNPSKQPKLDWKEELRTGRIRVQLLYSNPNRRQAEQVEAALQQWDLTHNQPGAGRRFSLHQRWSKNFAARPCEGHVLLVEVTKEFFAAHKNAVFVLKASGLHVGPDGEVVN